MFVVFLIHTHTHTHANRFSCSKRKKMNSNFIKTICYLSYLNKFSRTECVVYIETEQRFKRNQTKEGKKVKKDFSRRRTRTCPKERQKKLVLLLIKCCSIRKRFGGHLQFVVMFPLFSYWPKPNGHLRQDKIMHVRRSTLIPESVNPSLLGALMISLLIIMPCSWSVARPIPLFAYLSTSNVI